MNTLILDRSLRRNRRLHGEVAGCYRQGHDVAMVKLAEMFQQSSLDVISYSMMSHSMTISWEKVCRAMLSSSLSS